MRIKNYGELISKVINKPLLAYVEFGSYQGDYVAVFDDKDDIELWKGSYGSCSGCDWLEAERDWNTEEVPDEKAKEYVKDERYFAKIPKETIKGVDCETFISFLPANTRNDMYDFDGKQLYAEVMKSLNTPPIL